MPSVSPAVVPGKRGITFHPATPTQPGGKVNVVLGAKGADADPTNVYAFFVQPISLVPTGVSLTSDWFFKSGSPSGSAHISTADSSGGMQISVPGVKPSLNPYHVQTVLEYDS